MTPSAPILVVGSTGLLGTQIVQQLVSSGCTVRALVRHSSGPARVAALKSARAQVVYGDLKDEASIAAACEGVGTVVSTATSLLSRTEGDSIDSVDLRGQLNLVGAAERASVGHFVFISFPPIALDFAFQRAKRAVEARLRESALSFTIIQAASFAEIWLGPFLGFNPFCGRAKFFGDGTRPTSWISMADVASFAAAAAHGGPFARKTISLGGPDALSYRDVLDLFARHGAGHVAIESVPESELEAQFRSATDPRQEAFAATMLSRARGQVVSSDEACALWSGQLTRLNDFVAHIALAAQRAEPAT